MKIIEAFEVIPGVPGPRYTPWLCFQLGGVNWGSASDNMSAPELQSRISPELCWVFLAPKLKKYVWVTGSLQRL